MGRIPQANRVGKQLPLREELANRARAVRIVPPRGRHRRPRRARVTRIIALRVVRVGTVVMMRARTSAAVRGMVMVGKSADANRPAATSVEVKERMIVRRTRKERYCRKERDKAPSLRLAGKQHLRTPNPHGCKHTSGGN